MSNAAKHWLALFRSQEGLGSSLSPIVLIVVFVKEKQKLSL
jgi:hypothetical protein